MTMQRDLFSADLARFVDDDASPPSGQGESVLARCGTAPADGLATGYRTASASLLGLYPPDLSQSGSSEKVGATATTGVGYSTAKDGNVVAPPQEETKVP